MNAYRLLGVTVVGLCLIAPPSAPAQVSISQLDSTDPVMPGQQVTYSITITNQNPAEQDLWLGTLALKQGSEAPVANPYLSLSASQGSCSAGGPDSYGYWGGDCALGTVGAGASVTLEAVIEANYSMGHFVSVFYCDPYASPTCDLSFADSEPTTVIHPTAFSGSPKIEISGFPSGWPGCVGGKLTVAAKARGRGVRRMSANLAGPYNEFGRRPEGYGFSEPYGRAPGRRLEVEIKAAQLEQDNYYKLTFSALRKGPDLKRIATFPVC